MTALAGAAPAGALTLTGTDPAGDALAPRGDIISYAAVYGVSEITLNATMLAASNPFADPNWQYGITGVVWVIEVNGDSTEDFVVGVFGVGGTIRGEVDVASTGVKRCDATAEWNGSATFGVRFPASCIFTPASIRIGTGVLYDTNAFDPNAPVSEDYAPSPPNFSPFVLRDSNPPIGALDAVTPIPGGVIASGWTLDPNTPNAIQVHHYADGNPITTAVANQPRPDIGAAYPASGPNHGYSTAFALPPGTHNVCAYGINNAPGPNALLGCRTVTVGGPPFGSLDQVQPIPGGASVSGWAIDPDTAGPIQVHMYADGNPVLATTANQARGDIGSAFPAFGPNHGFSAIFALPPGVHDVCAYAINVGGGTNSLLGCRGVQVGGPPIGSLDAVTRIPGGVSVSGWAIDLDVTGAIQVHHYADGNPIIASTANQPRSDIAAAFPAYGPNHGFGTIFALGPGTHTVCAFGINVGTGSNSLLGCRSVS